MRSIFYGRWCVISTCLCLPQVRERTGQWSGDFGTSRLRGVAGLNIQRIVYRMRRHHFTPSLRSPSPRSTPAHPSTRQAVCTLDDTRAVVRATLWQLQVISKQLCSVACWTSWHSRLCWVDLYRARAWSSAAWALNQRQILQASGYTLLVGWKTIFEVLGSVCRLLACPFRPCFTISSFLARPRAYLAPPCSGMR